MEQPYVRPMGLGEILDASVKLYRKHFYTLVIAQLPMTVFYLGNYLVTTLGTGESTSFYDILEPAPTYMDADPTRLLIFSLISLLLSLVQVVIVYPLALSAVTKVASDSILGKEPSVKDALRFYRHYWFKLGLTNVVLSIALGIILGIVVGIPLAAIIIVVAFSGTFTAAVGLGILIALAFLGIGLLVYAFFWVRLQATYPVAVNEHTFIIRAMGRSWNMVKGDTLRTFFALVLISLIPYGLIFSSTFFELLLGESLGSLTLVFGTLSQGLLIPLVGAARTVIYFELRARKEGYDLEQRVKQLSN